jgi:phage-related minor tail protein
VSQDIDKLSDAFDRFGARIEKAAESFNKEGEAMASEVEDTVGEFNSHFKAIRAKAMQFRGILSRKTNNPPADALPDNSKVIDGSAVEVEDPDKSNPT